MSLKDLGPNPMPSITTDDRTTLYYRDWGDGRPLALLHSIGLSGAVWEGPMMALVGAGRRCVALDRRGHGRSDDPGRGYDFDTLAGTLTPSLLRSADNPEGFEASFWDDTIDSLVRDRAGVTVALSRTVLGADAPVERLHWVAGLAAHTSLLAIVACLRAERATDFSVDLGSMTLPTLLLHGDADVLNPLSVTAVRTARAIPQSRLEVYAGARHALFTTEPERFVANVPAFDECVSRRRARPRLRASRHRARMA